MKGFRLTASGVVLSKWIDRNGHMNVSEYMALFDKGTSTLLENCKIGILDRDLTMVAARIMVDHRKEFMEGDSWELWSGVAAADSTYITVTHRLSKGRALHAVCDIRGKPFSMRERAAAKFEKPILDNINEWIVPGLVDRFNK